LAAVVPTHATSHPPAYTEFGGDGDELGIALQRLGPDESEPNSLRFANQNTHATQQAADMLWTGTELVVAWQDTDNALTGPDLKYRVFDDNLVPLTHELTLADSAGPDGNVALAKLNGGFAASWRQGNDDGLENVKVFVDGEVFTTEAHLPAADTDKPALAEIEPGLLLVVYIVGTDPSTSGVAHVGRSAA
jgi:hypothetical protein